MVGVARIELATPAMSTQCSTTELHAHRGQPNRGSGDIWKRAFKRRILIPQEGYRRPWPAVPVEAIVKKAGGRPFRQLPDAVMHPR